jgi:diguanylate cyclase (GGDEF)-like protein
MFPPVYDDGFDRGLFTLTQIQHLMRVEFNRAERYGYPVTCMVLSVDRLGHLRDLYGYQSKEDILMSIVKMLERETRSTDYVGRLADDRLLVVVPHTGEEGAKILARRVLVGARELGVVHEGNALEVSVSIGASHNQVQGGPILYFDALMRAAEEAVAEATASGGDRFVVKRPGS